PVDDPCGHGLVFSWYTRGIVHGHRSSERSPDVEAAAPVQRELTFSDTMQPLAGAQIAAETKQVYPGKRRPARSSCLRQITHHTRGSMVADELGKRAGARPGRAYRRPGTTPQGELEQCRDSGWTCEARHDLWPHPGGLQLLLPGEERSSFEE